MTTSDKAPSITLEAPGKQGEKLEITLTEAEAAHLMRACAEAFEWNLGHNPLTDNFLKTLQASLDIADKIEGSG